MFKKIKYTSENGTAVLGGGQHALMRVRGISGLGVPGREYSTVATALGQREVGRRDLPRIITINGDLLGDGDALENFERIAYADGILELDFGDKQRRIHCKLNNMTDPTRIIPGKLMSFAIQFLCDNPYFEDTEPTMSDIATFTNTVIDTFTLPCVFTVSQNEQTIFVAGVKNVYPVVHIGCTKEGEESAEYGICINNITTGRSITIYHRMRVLESVIIDLKERTITSSLDGSIINSLSDDSDMADFYLQPGNNTLIVQNISNAETNNIQIEFRSEYIAAEY